MAISQREAFAQLMEHLCTCPNHGYSQPNRWGDGTTEDVTLSEGTVIQIAGGDRDCSSAVCSCLTAVGVDIHGATYTGNMKDGILASGLFDWYPMSEDHYARRGDIYLNISHHTAICTNDDPDTLAQFSISENGTVDGDTGDQTGNESNIRSYYSYPWTGRLCWKDDGATIGVDPDPARSIQLYDGNATDAQRFALQLDSDGYYRFVCVSCGLALDVACGKAVSGAPVRVYPINGTDAQKWQLIKTDGCYSPESARPIQLAPKLDTSLRLDCIGGGKDNGTGIQLYPANGSAAQLWVIEDHGDATWTFINTGSSQALDVVGGGH